MNSFLAPMAGYTDRAFRELCANYGASLVMTDLVSSERIIRTELKFNEKYDNTLFAIQLWGNNVEIITKAAQKIEHQCDLIDINLGCPSPNILKQGGGASWLKDIRKIEKLQDSLSINLKKPFSIKVRAGFSKNHLVHKEIAEISNKFKGKLFMITLHARTVDQAYSGDAYWDWIKEMVKITDVPICGNGNIKSPDDVNKMIKQTGCKYAMIGRATRGNPFIFENKIPTKKEKIQSLKQYLQLAEKYKIKFSIIKNNTIYFFNTFDSAPKIRNEINKTKTIKELREFLNNLI